MSHIITGLDIGTSAIKGLCARQGKGRDLEVLAQIREESCEGMKKGTVMGVERVAQGIIRTVNSLNKVSSCKIDEVYVTINGGHISSTRSDGKIIVSRADRIISKEEVDRVLQEAQVIPLPSNTEILEVFPMEYIVDGTGGIKDPLGIQGLKLEVKVLASCAFSLYFKNLTNAVLDAGLGIKDIIAAPVASARALLTPQQKDLGVCVLDIGAGTTGLAVYKDGDLIYLSVLPVGSDNITQDLAIVLQTEIDIAERIKREFGSCILPKSGNKKEKITIPGEEYPLVFSHKMVAGIIEARISQILTEVNKKLKEISPPIVLPSGVVLTGGGAKLPKIVEFARKKLKLPVRIGQVRGFVGLDEDPIFSAACGLVLSGIEERGGVSGRSLLSGIKKIFKTFSP